MAEEHTSFLGRGWDFPPAFDKTIKGVRMTSDRQDIEKSLEILLTTNLGERFLQPEYGCDLSDMVFNPQNLSAAYIRDLINDAVLFHEPRIELEKVEVKPGDEEGTIIIQVVYTILATNTRYNYVYPFYIEEGTRL